MSKVWIGKKGESMREIINCLKMHETYLNYELENKPMEQDERYAKVDALEKIGKAITILETIEF